MTQDSGYQWRRMTANERTEARASRKREGRPWHSPPHPKNYNEGLFHLTAACYEHRPHIGHSMKRMDRFADELLNAISSGSARTHAWCVLPNHYHALVETENLKDLVQKIGLFHGRSSYLWNGEEDRRGRKVFYRSSDRAMRSEPHFWATINYVHHNAVHHGYVQHWTDWPWSSAAEYLAEIGEAEAKRIWKVYPVLDYGKGWDDPAL